MNIDKHVADMFKTKPEPGELDKLFINAPVIIGDDLVTTSYYKETKRKFRLPTVKEAPRNIWLAPWLKIPKELIGKNVLFLLYVDDIIHYPVFEVFNDGSWDEVKAIMIIENFKSCILIKNS